MKIKTIRPSDGRAYSMANVVAEAIGALNGKATYAEIKSYIHSKWNGMNDRTISAHMIS